MIKKYVQLCCCSTVNAKNKIYKCVSACWTWSKNKYQIAPPDSVYLVCCANLEYFKYLDSMVELQQTGIVAQLVGMCEEPAWPEVVLQYHSLGSLLSVAQMPSDLDLRWRVVMSYLDVVEKLHNEVPRSPRVLCDASRTEITLSQVNRLDLVHVHFHHTPELGHLHPPPHIPLTTDPAQLCNSKYNV